MLKIIFFLSIQFLLECTLQYMNITLSHTNISKSVRITIRYDEEKRAFLRFQLYRCIYDNSLTTCNCRETIPTPQILMMMIALSFLLRFFFVYMFHFILFLLCCQNGKWDFVDCCLYV